MKTKTQLKCFLAVGTLAVVVASYVLAPTGRRSSSSGTVANSLPFPNTSAPAVVLTSRPVIQREFAGVTNAEALTTIWNFMRSTSWEAAVTPGVYWYVDGKLVAEPPRFRITGSRAENLDPPPVGDAAATQMYLQRMRSRAVDTFDFRHSSPPLDLNDLKP